MNNKHYQSMSDEKIIKEINQSKYLNHIYREIYFRFRQIESSADIKVLEIGSGGLKMSEVFFSDIVLPG